MLQKENVDEHEKKKHTTYAYAYTCKYIEIRLIDINRLRDD